MRLFVLTAISLFIISGTGSALAVDRPNILWIVAEDLSPWIDSYGYSVNQGKTPTMDELGAEGVRFSRAFVPSPVCSSCRSGFIVGAMQTTTGTHNHRSSRSPQAAIRLPKGIKPIPQLLKEAGYYTFNRGKDDYNFVYKRPDLYSIGNPKPRKGFYGKKGSGDWSMRPEGTPFFGQIQLGGGKSNTKSVTDKVSPDSMTPPPYFPNTPLFRRWWAHHYDTVRKTDADIQKILNQLKADGLLENTVVFFFSDHGNNHSVRHKQFCFEGGCHVPLYVMWKGNTAKINPGQVREDLVSILDVSATTMVLAGLKIPDYVEGQDLFAADFKPREYVVSARDRCDYTIDRIRTIRTDRFRYIRNFLTDRPLLQPQYRDNRDYVKALREGHAAGSLAPKIDAIFFGKRPAEELYDLQKDPHEMNNLANDPKFAEELMRHRGLLESWIKKTDDQGQYPESAAGLRAIKKRWGKKCVNPEFQEL